MLLTEKKKPPIPPTLYRLLAAIENVKDTAVISHESEWYIFTTSTEYFLEIARQFIQFGQWQYDIQPVKLGKPYTVGGKKSFGDTFVLVERTQREMVVDFCRYDPDISVADSEFLAYLDDDADLTEEQIEKLDAIKNSVHRRG